MKLYKSLFIVAALVGGMMTSCSDEGSWTQASPSDLGLTAGTAYAFNAEALNYTYYPADMVAGTDIEVTITRGATTGSVVLPIAAEFSDSTLISGPSSVTFADGQNTAVYAIHFEREIEIGESATAVLTIDTLKVGIPVVDRPAPLDSTATAADSAKYQADSTAYAAYITKLSSYKLATKVNIQKDYNWVSLGTGKITENGYFKYVEAGNVEIMQAQENEHLFRVVSPWDALFSDNGYNPETNLDGNQTDIKFRVLQKGETLSDNTITYDDLVYFEPSNTGYINSTYDQDVYIFHPADISNSALEAYWLHNKVLSYQESGLPAVVQLAPRYWLIGLGGWNHSQEDEVMTITFPGVKIYDYSATMEYAGLFTDPSDVVYALADYELTGADISEKNVKVALISQSDDAEAVADAIAAGEFEDAYALSEVAKDGRIQIAIPDGMTGKLQVILVVLDKNDEGADEVKNVVAAKFEYYGGANPWTALGVGYYTEDIIYSTFTSAHGTWTYQVEIDEHSETPGLYRIRTPYAYWAEWWGEGSGEEDILVHAEDPNGVYINEQPLGLYDSGDPLTFCTRGGFLVDDNSDDDPSIVINSFKGQFGTLESGEITFPLLTATSDDGETNFQGYLYIGESGYYVGMNGAIAITLPDAAASVKAKAAARAKASTFEANMMKYSKRKSVSRKSVKAKAKFASRELREKMLSRTMERIK